MTDERVKIVCYTCNSSKVTRDAWASWDEATQDWVLAAVYDYAFCHNCENDTRLTEAPL